MNITQMTVSLSPIWWGQDQSRAKQVSLTLALSSINTPPARIRASSDPDIHRSRTTKSFSSCRFSWGENGSGWKSGAILGRRTNPQLEELARDGNGRVYQIYCFVGIRESEIIREENTASFCKTHLAFQALFEGI